MINSQQNGLEGSLGEILYGKNATEEQIDEVRNLIQPWMQEVCPWLF